MKFFKLSNLKEYSILFWLTIVTIIIVISLNIYKTSKKDQVAQIQSSIENIYLKKTIKEITTSLKPRYKSLQYIAKSGDTYQSIINKLEINETEKKILLKTILNEKTLKILRINQKFSLKLDNLNKGNIVNFKIETDKKNEILFTRSNEENIFKTKKIKKNFTKSLEYKETVILDSLYNSAINLGIKPNIIIEFARLYGFQIDFQRDIWKNDSFQIIYEQFTNENNVVVDTGEIIFANLNLQNTDYQLYKFEYEENKIDYFDENGKSIRKTLMKTPINGARLSSSFGMRKHTILGYNKMHRGTDFAAPSGTPIMASGSGTVTRARWCGGGGNCVKIKHNSTYETIYAHMKSFAKGIKEGRKVKQGQIIGYVGSTGLSTGPHLHYEVIVNGKKVNSQKLKLPSGKILRGEERKEFELARIKIDLKLSELR